MALLLFILIGGLILAVLTTVVFSYLGYSLFKKADNSQISTGLHNYAANNPGTMSSIGPWGTAISGISKMRGFGNG